MSHASVIVALSPEQIASAGGVEEAVAFQMAPFEESSWFADGTRWDWYSIGGRYSGKFAPPDYEPEDDPANLEACFICGGTGVRSDALGREHRKQNPGYTCNGCGGKGKSVKHASHWRQVGNICKRADLDESALIEGRKVAAEKLWVRWLAEERKDDFVREYVYGLEAGDTMETVIARYQQSPLSAYAFLKDRRWCEKTRMGWFGADHATECEIKAEASGEEWTGRCLYKDEKTGAQIVSFQEGEDDDDRRWARLYWARFIRSLPPETTLVVVDYHV